MNDKDMNFLFEELGLSVERAVELEKWAIDVMVEVSSISAFFKRVKAANFSSEETYLVLYSVGKKQGEIAAFDIVADAITHLLKAINQRVGSTSCECPPCQRRKDKGGSYL